MYNVHWYPHLNDMFSKPAMIEVIIHIWDCLFIISILGILFVLYYCTYIVFGIVLVSTFYLLSGWAPESDCGCFQIGRRLHCCVTLVSCCPTSRRRSWVPSPSSTAAGFNWSSLRSLWLWRPYGRKFLSIYILLLLRYLYTIYRLLPGGTYLIISLYLYQ